MFGGPLSIEEYRDGFSTITNIQHIHEVFILGERGILCPSISRPYIYTLSEEKAVVLPVKATTKAKSKAKAKVKVKMVEEESVSAPVVHVRKKGYARNVIQSLQSHAYSSIMG